MRLQQKYYSIPKHLPPMSHTGHSSNVASGGASSDSTFEPDAEAQSQGVTPLVTPPTTPNSRDGKKLHQHHSPKGKVILKKKDEARHKDKATHKDSDSTSSKRSHGGKGGKHGSSKDSISPEAYPGHNRLPFLEEMEGASAGSFPWAHEYTVPQVKGCDQHG